jgi:hypothetical protein
MRFVMSKIPEREVIRDGVRNNDKLVPEIAVRELLANVSVVRICGSSGPCDLMYGPDSSPITIAGTASSVVSGSSSLSATGVPPRFMETGSP